MIDKENNESGFEEISLTPEDGAILDRVWDEIAKRDLKPRADLFSSTYSDNYPKISLLAESSANLFPNHVAIPVPSELNMYQGWLKNKTLTSQPPQKYDAGNWHRRFQSPALESFLTRYPNGISRKELAELGTEVHNSGIQMEALQCFFWGVMLWGWSKAGHGPVRVEKIFKVAEPFDLLAKAFNYIQTSNIDLAYKTLGENSPAIKYFGEAYFTKFLYFAGLGCGLKHYPLILDSKVLSALKTLIGDKAPRAHRQKDFLMYVDTLHNWAGILECRADSIEYLLYLMPNEFWQNS